MLLPPLPPVHSDQAARYGMRCRLNVSRTALPCRDKAVRHFRCHPRKNRRQSSFREFFSKGSSPAMTYARPQRAHYPTIRLPGRSTGRFSVRDGSCEAFVFLDCSRGDGRRVSVLFCDRFGARANCRTISRATFRAALEDHLLDVVTLRYAAVGGRSASRSPQQLRGVRGR